MQSSQINVTNYIKLGRTIQITKKRSYTHTIIIIIIQVKYECSGVYIVMTSRQKFNAIKGIFNKVDTSQSLKVMYVVTILEYILW